MRWRPLKGRDFILAPPTTGRRSRSELPNSDWAFADCSSTPFPGKPDLTKLCVKGGFNPALAYTLAFTAKNPKVLGIGFAATRDLVAFLRYDASAPTRSEGKVRWAIGRGVSQSGNYLRSLIHLGFNTAEDGGSYSTASIPSSARE